MDFSPFIKVQVQLVLIVWLLNTTSAAPFFGVDIPAPNKDIRAGVGEISSPNPLLNNQNHHQHEPHNTLDSMNPLPRAESVYRPYGNFFNPPPMGFSDHAVKLAPEQPLGYVNVLTKLTQDSNIIPAEVQSSDDSKDPSSLNPVEETNKKTETSEGVDKETYTLGWSDTGTDYTTETAEYETTTDEPLNRIGGPAPAVVATLLG